MCTNMKKQMESKCIMCGVDVNPTAHKDCPTCGNVLGLSVNELEVTSIGGVLCKEQVADNVLVFAFDFEFNTQLECFKTMNFNNMAKPFLGITIFISASDFTGFGEVSAVAVFNGKHEIDVKLNKEHMNNITKKIRPYIEAYMQGININDIDYEEVKDNSSKDESKCVDGMVNLLDIANAMFSITSDDFFVDEDMWNSLTSDIKVDIAKALQLNPRDLVDLMNCTKYNYANVDTDKLRSKAESIIANHVKSDFLNGFKNFLDDALNEFVKLSETNLEYALVNMLCDNLVEYKVSDAFEVSDFTNKYTMVSILNNDNKECFYIVPLDDEYRIFENVRELKGDKFFDFNEKNSTSLKLDEIESIIHSMGLIKDEVEELTALDDSNCLEANTKEEIPVSEEDILETRRQTLIAQLHELSDEDLLNELRRRMSSK